MTGGHLLREHAPISERSWTLVDDEARARLVVALGARRVLDFGGPHGWEHSATNLGRIRSLSPPLADRVEGSQRRVLPLVELRAAFSVSRAELSDHDRGAVHVDLAGLDEAALQIASTENIAVLHGWDAAGIVGMTEASPYPPVPRVADFGDYPQRVASAVSTLMRGGVGGPYALLLGPNDYTAVIEAAPDGGYPIARHVGSILGGPIVWAPGLRGGLVASLRGGDFLFESGEDLAVGYRDHDAAAIQFYLEETFSFRVATPEASVALAALA